MTTIDTELTWSFEVEPIKVSLSSTDAAAPFVLGWGISGLDANDLYLLQEAVQRYFRHRAAESIGNPLDMGHHVRTIASLHRLVAALEEVEKYRKEAFDQHVARRRAERLLQR